MTMRLAEQIGRPRRRDAVLIGVGALDHIGRVEHDPQTFWRRNLPQQPRGAGGGAHHIGVLRLDAEIDIVLLSARVAAFAISVSRSAQASARVVCQDGGATDRRGRACRCRASPATCPWRAPRSLTAPAATSLARARPDRGGSCCRCRTEPRSPHRSVRWPRRWWPSGAWRDRVRHRGQTATGEVELHASVARITRGGEDRLGRRAGKGLREDAEWRRAKWGHNAPETSSSRTGRPVSTERAMATMARMLATPSSASAPRMGAPCRIVSAKPSICRR